MSEQKTQKRMFDALTAKVICALAVVITGAVVALPTLAQNLYLFSAIPTPQSSGRFASALYRVNAQSGTLEKVRTVVGDDMGVDFVEADYDHRLLVVGFPPVVPSTFAVVNMDDPRNETSIRIPLDRKSGVKTHYLLDVPGRGIGQALNVFDATTDAEGRLLENRGSERLTVAWLSGAPSNWEVLPWTDMLYVRCGGYYGTGTGSDNSLWVRPGSDGILRGDIRWVPQENLGIPVPPHLTPPLAKYEYLFLSVNNGEMAVISRAKEPGILYRATVNSDSLGKPEQLAKDPVIFQVHWAFLSAAQ